MTEPRRTRLTAVIVLAAVFLAGVGVGYLLHSTLPRRPPFPPFVAGHRPALSQIRGRILEHLDRELELTPEQRARIDTALPLPAARFAGVVVAALACSMPTRGRPGGMVGPEMLKPAVVDAPTVPGLGGFSGAVKVGLTVYLSGQVALDSAGRVVGPNDLRMQLRQALQNAVTLVKAARGLPGDVVKLTVYVVDYTPDHLETIREWRPRFSPPRRGRR